MSLFENAEKQIIELEAAVRKLTIDLDDLKSMPDVPDVPDVPNAPFNPQLGDIGGRIIHGNRHLFVWPTKEGWQFNIEIGTAQGVDGLRNNIFWRKQPITGGEHLQTDKWPANNNDIWVRFWYGKVGETMIFTDYKYSRVGAEIPVEIPTDAKGRALLMIPDMPTMFQENALPLVFNDDGTVEISKSKQVEFSHEPEKQGAPVVEGLGPLATAIKSRVPLVRIKGTAMRGMSLSLTSEKFNGIIEGVTIIEPEHDGAVAPSIYLQDTSAVVARGFKWQNRSWKFRSNGVCNSNGVSGLGFVEKVTKTPVAFNAPDRNRGMMENNFAQDMFSVYDHTVGYDEVQVAFGTADIGWTNGKVAHARNCRVYNINGLNHGDRMQCIANFKVNGDLTLARTNMEDCLFAAGLGMATFSSGKDGGNTSPENGDLDDKCQSDNIVKPLRSFGGSSIGFGPSSSDLGIGTIEHGVGGHAQSSNHLGIAMPTCAASSAYSDMDGVEIAHNYVCGGGDYEHWKALGFTNYKYRSEEFAFFNYVNIKGVKPAIMHSNRAYAHKGIGYGGGTMLKDNEVVEKLLKFSDDFVAADGRLANGLKIFVPVGATEIIW